MDNGTNLFLGISEKSINKIFSFLTMKEILRGMHTGKCITKPLLHWGIPRVYCELMRLIKSKKLSLNQLISQNGKICQKLEREMKYVAHQDWINAISYYCFNQFKEKKRLDDSAINISINTSHILNSNNYLHHSLMGDYGLEVLTYLFSYQTNITKISLEKTALIDKSKYLCPFLIKIKDLKNLTELNLSLNKIGDIGAKCLFETLRKSISPIKILNLNHNNISFQSCPFISNYLISTDTLNYFDMGYNILGPNGIGLITGAIQANTSLEFLELNYNGIRSEGCQYLLKALEYNQNLTYIGLAGNYLHDEGFKYISKILSMNTDIQRIDLQYNNCDNEALNYLSIALGHNNILKEIDLSGNKITFDMSMNFFHNLHLYSSLNTLIIKDNNLDYKTVYSLLQGALKNTHLTSLDISNNKLNDQCCKALFDFLKFNKHINVLDLSNCNLGSNLHFISEGLKLNTSLTSFKINHNQLSNDTLIDLISALKFNYSLKELYLSNNGINDDIAKEFSKFIISSQTKIQYIDFANNNITQKGGNFFLEAIKLTPLLLGLNFENNNINKDMQIAITKSISSYSTSRMNNINNSNIS